MVGAITNLMRIGLLFLLCSPLMAIGATVGLVVESKTAQVTSFHSKLQEASPDLKIQLYTTETLPDSKQVKQVKSWMAMGPKALAVLLGRSNGNSRVLGLFVREQAKSKLKKLYPNKRFSILDNTPSLDRQLALIKVLNPQVKNVAVFHSVQFKDVPSSLLKMAKALNIELNVSQLKDPLNWNRDSLKKLKDSDLVLGLNDSAIYNATTIRSILMRLYRAGRPLVGPDKGYVRAGAVASTYSGVVETLQAITVLLKDDQPWPEIIYNPYFNVSVNTQVARSLNISVGSPEQIREKVKEYLP